MRALALLLAAATLAAGCLGTQGATLAPQSAAATHVVGEDGAPIPYATYALLAAGAPVARGSAGLDGALWLPVLAWDTIVLSATGFEARALSPADLGAPTVALARAGSIDPLDATPTLRMLPPHEFDPYVFGPQAACSLRNTCGLSEPVLENAPNGVVYASATCCVGGSPPVWVSRDAGASWGTLDTPGVREAVGIEGDFAVDAAGNVYFTDILVGAMWITSWDKDGAWRHTTPVALPPIVDRPWVRAGAEDVVYFLYNTGASTGFHVSTDGGRTFSPVATHTFPDGLGTFAQGPELDHLWVTAGDKLYESTDGGATWSDGEDVPMPDNATKDEGHYGFIVPAVDAAGNVGVAYDFGSKDTGYAIFLATRSVEGAWQVSQASPMDAACRGTHVLPWVEAGPAGGFVVAWYGVPSETSGPDDVAKDSAWYAYVAATHDAGASWQAALADEESVLAGPMARRLLDFLQVDLDESGAAHVVYSHNREGGNDERTSYARTTIGLGLPQLPPVAGNRPGLLPGALEPLVLKGATTLARA